VIRTALVLVFLLTAAAAAAELPIADFSEDMIADVFATALDFIAPRLLTPVSVRQLTLSGLRGLSVIDPTMTLAESGNHLRLLAADQVLYDGEEPDEDDADDWGETAAELSEAAWANSAAIRHAGTQTLITDFFDELFDPLDRYSRYVPPAEAEPDRSQRSGQAGIGATLIPRGGALVVAELVPDGPAAAAGLRRGDRVVAIDRAPVSGHDAEAAIALLSGNEKNPVTLTVESRGVMRELVIARAALSAPRTVFAERRSDVLVLRLTGFNSRTGAAVERALAEAMAGRNRPRGVVFDLRGNLGGPLDQAVAVAATVLGGGGLVATTVGRDPAANRVLQADAADVTGGLPVVVLVDGASASAAEIVAAALADDRRAVVVGSATQGKGLIQTVTMLPDGGELFVTWSRVLAPLGWPIQRLGVLPQVCTSLGQTELERQLADLAAGVAPLAHELALSRAARTTLSAEDALAIRNTCPAAEGGDLDLAAARFLIRDPEAYVTALLPAQLRATEASRSP
jgi:carboxyl-terminal processing protease